jgi:hypothetical protein
MKGDFTRNTYKKRNHYSRVLMQQGRVQLDADWNEQLAIDAHVDRTVRRDVIGHCGGPQGDGPGGEPLAGFLITPDDGNVSISAGRYYVNGILAENDTARLFTEQADYRQAELPTAEGNYLFYLDVWERHINALDDPDIREVALNGPDTASRARVMAQVKWELVDDQASCQDFGPGWTPSGAQSTGRLAARSEPDPTTTDPCVVPEEAGYRRLENQLYRVEIHAGGALDSATFKWSRENGSVVTRWLDQDGDKLTVSSAGRDAVLGFTNQQWVELSDEVRDQAGIPGTLVMIDSVDGNVITIDPATATGTTDLSNFDAGTARVRRWESEGAQTVTVPASNDGWIPLEGGVQIKFQSGAFRSGDYWLIPARTVSGDVEWDEAAGSGPEGFQLAHGIHHDYCPLAIGPFDGSSWGELTDCRHLFPPLTEIERGESCCTVTVGDGVLSTGDYADIQAAVDSLESSGSICILPGVYQLQEPVLVENLDIAISGCGRNTAILAGGTQPALVISGGQARLSSLSILASAPQGALVAKNPQQLVVEDCQIVNRQRQGEVVGGDYAVATRLPSRRGIFSLQGVRRMPAARFVDRSKASIILRGAGPAVTIAGGGAVKASENLLVGMPAVLSQAGDVEILSNDMIAGGVWLADGSSGVLVQGNDISRGEGAGVILGGVPANLGLPDQDTGVVSVYIDDNTITGMLNSGVSSVAQVDENLDLGELEDIYIRANRIRHCGLKGPDPFYDPIAVGGIVLRHVSGLRISDNLIAQNGGQQVPACGVFTYACLGLEAVNNHIEDNGTTAQADSSQENCLLFETMDASQGEGPFESDLATFASVDSNNQPVGFTIEDVGDSRGLNCRFGTEIALAEPAAGMRMRLVVGNRAVITATRADGSQEQATLSSQEAAQQVSFSGPDIEKVNVQAPNNEAWLLEFCAGEAGAIPVGYQAGLAAMYAVGGEVSDPSQPAGSTFQASGPAAMVHDNVIVCPRGQSLIVAGVGPVSVSDNTLTSQGVRAQPKASETDIFSQLAVLGPGVFIANLGRTPGIGTAAAAGFTRVGGMNYTTKARVGVAAATRSTLPDGRTQFHGNQVTLEILENAPRFVVSCTAIVSFDDVSIQDNQVLTQINGGGVYASLVAFGITARATGNRIHELPNQALASYYSIGLLNIATGNQGTHCIYALGTQAIDQDNQEVITTRCPSAPGLEAADVKVVGIGDYAVDRKVTLRH